MTLFVCRFLFLFLIREVGIGMEHQCEVMYESENRWSVRPLAGQSYEYAAMEMSLPRGDPDLIRITGIGRYLAHIQEEGDETFFFISPTIPVAPSDIRILSPYKPENVSLRLSTRLRKSERESIPAEIESVWVFRSGNISRGSWNTRGIAPVAVPDTHHPDKPAIFRTDGTGRIEIMDGWAGINATDHPVAFIQYQVDSGIGKAAIHWTTDNGYHTHSMEVAFSNSGSWNQTLIPLYKHPRWRGMVKTLAFSPVDHPALFRIDWMAFPTLEKPWSWLIYSSRNQVLAFGLLFIVVISVTSVFRRRLIPNAPYVLLAACAITPVLLPFDTLRANIPGLGIHIPLYLFVLVGFGVHTVSKFHASWIVRSALLCILYSIIHATIVGNGSGLQSLPVLLAGPLAFVASYGLSDNIGRQNGILLITGILIFLGVWSIVFSLRGHDPLYGSLIQTIGRLYHDITSEGRIAGAFVHPLVLASCALISISCLHAVIHSNVWRIPVMAVLGLIVIMTRSRSAICALFLMMLFMLVKRYLRPRSVIILALLTAVLVVVLTHTRESQGISRSLHFAKRIDGIRVAAGTFDHKPLQGVGWGKYERAVKRFGPDRAILRSYTTPDSSYARIAVEGGLLGLSVWLLWMVSLSFPDRGHSKTDPHRNPYTGWPITALLIVFMAGVFDALYWPAFSVPAFSLLGFMKS